MIKKEEIEELEKDITICMEKSKEIIGQVNYNIPIFLTKYLYDLGYRKIPKNGRIITANEYETFKHLENANCILASAEKQAKKHDNFSVKTLKNLYRIHQENAQRLLIKHQIAEANLQDEILIIKSIENAFKKKGILPNQIDIEEISENPLTNEEN